ncbi:hypothetical protein I926_09560 [Pasteurella multocida subsp. multocida OH4807]|nr:hypothetical protein I926_09560 [Pasteurella multocida subsp. multocida OH4807]
MFNDNQRVSNKGNNNQIAFGDINNIISLEQKKESSITNILNYLSNIVREDVTYQELNIGEYTIKEKIDFNNIEIYKDDLEDYIDFYYRIDDKMKIYNETDPMFLERTTQYVKAVYKRCDPKNKKPDSVISEMENKINDEIIRNTSIKSLDDLSYITYVVFYIFAKCKIFKKPIKNYVT